MTTDLFERRLRRDLDVIADALTAHESHVPMTLPAPPRHGGGRRKTVMVAAAAATVAVAGVAVVAGGPDETVTAGPVAPGCPATAAQPADGDAYLVGSDEVDGTEWSVRTSGTAYAPDVAVRSYVGPEESTGIHVDEASWPSIVNDGAMDWMYDTNPATFVIAYGLLPPEAEAVRLTVDGNVSEVCAVAVPGEAVRYFATTFAGVPDEVVAVDASGSTILRDTPAGRLASGGAVGTSVTAEGRVSLPVGGTAAAEAAPPEPVDVLADGRTAGVDWELRVGAGAMFLVPFGGISGADARDGVYMWEAVRRGDGWWLWGDAPADVTTVHLRFADGHTESATVQGHPDVSGRSFFAVAAEGHEAPDQAVLVYEDGTVATVEVDDRIPSEPADRTNQSFEIRISRR